MLFIDINNSYICCNYSKIVLISIDGNNMQERKLNRNALRSKALIRDAFLLLIKEKPFGSITVTDIVKRADINRTTFYAHYSCIADIANELENEIIDKLNQVLTEFSFESFIAQPSRYTTRLLLEVSKFLDENLEAYRTLLENTDATEFINRLTDLFIQYMVNGRSLPPEIKNTKKFIIRAYYLAGGISSVYQNWIKGKLDCSIYDIPLELGELFSENNILIEATKPKV